MIACLHGYPNLDWNNFCPVRNLESSSKKDKMIIEFRQLGGSVHAELKQWLSPDTTGVQIVGCEVTNELRCLVELRWTKPILCYKGAINPHQTKKRRLQTEVLSLSHIAYLASYQLINGVDV